MLYHEKDKGEALMEGVKVVQQSRIVVMIERGGADAAQEYINVLLEPFTPFTNVTVACRMDCILCHKPLPGNKKHQL